MELVELPSKDKKKGSQSQAQASSNHYMLKSTLPAEKMSQLLNWKAELPRLSLLYMILALIMMSNQVLSEERLFHYLTSFKLEKEMESDVFNDNAEGVLKSFVNDKWEILSFLPPFLPSWRC